MQNILGVRQMPKIRRNPRANSRSRRALCANGDEGPPRRVLGIKNDESDGKARPKAGPEAETGQVISEEAGDAA